MINPAMSEGRQSQSELSELTTRVANVEEMVRFGLSASREARTHAKEHFEEMKNSARVYLELGEPKTQEQLRASVGLSQPQVSRICDHLKEKGFISRDKSPTNRKEMIYRWNDVERIVGLSKIARDCVRPRRK
jgi:DNA-binding HxlR family transcriptional regulator